MSDRELMKAAEEARKHAYAPYSGFCVGAALLTEDGEVYCGCNIENASYSATVCAERVAVAKAVSEGKRSFSAIAIVGGRIGDVAEICAPCGVCRQVLSEFCTPSFRVLLGNSGHICEYRLSELLPLAFGPSDLTE